MTAIDELLNRHNQAATTAAPTPSAPQPSLHVAVLICMDARIQEFELLGLNKGEAHILRNAGGVVTDDVIRSLALSQRKLGTREVMVVQHTGCGVSAVTEDDFKDELERDSGLRPTWSVEAFREVKDSVRRSVTRVRRSPYLPHTDSVRGFVYDVHSGALEEVV